VSILLIVAASGNMMSGQKYFNAFSAKN